VISYARGSQAGCGWPRGAVLTGRDSGAVAARGIWGGWRCATGRQDLGEGTGFEVNDDTPGLALCGC